MNSRELLHAPGTSVAGAVLAPGLLLLAIRFLLGGPAASPASVSLAPAPAGALLTVTTPPTKLSDTQQRAVDWLSKHPQTITASPGGPMEPPLAPTITAPVTPTTPTQPTPKPAPHADPLASIKLSTILGHDHTGLVSIAGKTFRLGDEITEGWRIKSIDAKNRLIVVSHTNEAERTLHLEP